MNHITLKELWSIQARSTNKLLVLEYSNIQDYAISTHWNMTIRPDLQDYSMEAFIDEGWNYFNILTVYPSHPNTPTPSVVEK